MVKILVVEDNPANMELVVCVLEANGIEVTQAADGQGAIEAMKADHFHLVLLDIQLPGMCGLEIIERIRQGPSFKDVPFVALTAHAMEGDEKSFIDAGCVGYISKPIDVSQFMEKVNYFLNLGGV